MYQAGSMFQSGETDRQRLERGLAQVKIERSSFEAHWRDLGEQFYPRRTRFFDSDRNRGDKRHNKIINCAGPLAARTLRSGMMAGITSPARPWRRLTTPDPDLAEYQPVKEWLSVVNKRMATVSLRSNLYHALPYVYGDASVFGTGPIGIFDDDEDGMRFYTFPAGSYWLACNQRGIVDTFWRELQMTVRQMVLAFGNPQATPANRWANFSTVVQRAWDAGNYETPISVMQYIGPNLGYHPERLDAKYKKFKSCWYEKGTSGGLRGGDADKFLKESGYDLFPIMGLRWNATQEDVYGTSCPGMEALGDTRELQLLERRKSRAIEKQVNPPLVGPTSLRSQKTSLLPGDITYSDDRDGMKGLRSIHDTTVQINQVLEDIATKERRISRCFYEDLFLMLAQMEGIQPRNAKEIAVREEEKLLALGPVLESCNDDLLDPLTDLQFDKMLKMGLVPRPPDEIMGMDLRVEYVSIMAQAQKLVGVAGLERFVGFVGNMLAAFPEVRHKVNAFTIVDDYADMMGVNPKAVPSDEEAVASLQQEQQAIAQSQAGEKAVQSAQAAKLLSETDTTTPSALTALLGGR